MSARFYIVESTGYRKIGVGSDAQQITEVLVLDRDYCHEVVWSSWPGHREHFTEVDLIQARGHARRLCRTLNEAAA